MLFIFVVKYIQHRICHFNSFKVYNLVELLLQCCTTTATISKMFSSLQTKILQPLSNNSPFASSAQALVTDNLLSVSMNLPLLEISSQWNYMIVFKTLDTDVPYDQDDSTPRCTPQRTDRQDLHRDSYMPAFNAALFTIAGNNPNFDQCVNRLTKCGTGVHWDMI